MKLLSLFIGILLFSCNQENSEIKISKSNSRDSTISDYKDIFGEWSMCTTSSNGMMIEMNTCKTIVFNNNGTGYIGNNSSIAENFTWTFKKPGMKIMNTAQNADPTFPDTFYYADFNNREGRIDLILKHNNNSFYLSK